MSLAHSYTLLAPVYDLAIARLTAGARRRSLQRLPATPGRVLLPGIGPGLDIPDLPPGHHYTGLDLTPAMLRRATRRPGPPVALTQGDAQCLPFAAASFDAVVLHLILAVVPEPLPCLQESARVLRPGGCLLIFDKLLPEGRPAPLRRLLNPLSRRIATRLDVRFAPLLAACPGLVLESDQAALAGGWFRQLQLRRLA